MASTRSAKGVCILPSRHCPTSRHSAGKSPITISHLSSLEIEPAGEMGEISMQAARLRLTPAPASDLESGWRPKAHAFILRLRNHPDLSAWNFLVGSAFYCERGLRRLPPHPESHMNSPFSLFSFLFPLYAAQPQFPSSLRSHHILPGQVCSAWRLATHSGPFLME
jgi:hypothetical protein